MIAVLMASSLLNIAYLLPVFIRGFFAAPPEGAEPPSLREAPALCVAPLCLTAIGSVVLFFFSDSIYHLLLPIVER